MNADNPLYRFHYCPICGSPHFDTMGDNARHCAHCDFIYYTNPRAATVAIIRNDYDELLVGQRRNDPARGTLDLVGGFADIDETVEQAMCREIKEETGLSVTESQLHYLFSEPNTYPYAGICIKTLDMFFEIHLPADAMPQGSDDIAHLRWVPRQQLVLDDFGLGSIRRGLQRYLLNR